MRRAQSLAVLIAFSATTLQAQTTFATITGTVLDPSGLTVPGARVQAVQLESGYKYEAQTNAAGVYTLADLRAGTYDLTITAGGFKDAQVKGVELVSRDVRRLDVPMQLGQVATTVEVGGGGATLVETETARISQTRPAYDMDALPLNTRSLTAFLSLSPGVVSASDVTATRRFAGSRRNQSDVAVDGVSTTASNGTQISPLTNYIESFSEARVDMANNTADASAIGEVTAVSKAGTNQLHGSVFDYYVTPMFRARDPFSPERGSGISHRPGGALGGPVVIPHLYHGKNRTFFYASYETSQGSVSQQLLNPSVPLDSWRTGDFSALLPTTVVKDPTTGKGFAGNIIPKERLNATAMKIQDLFYPHANFGNTSVFTAANYREIQTHPFDPNNYWTARVDHRFGQNAFVFGRYTWQRQNTSFDSANTIPSLVSIHDQRNTRQILLSWTQTITPQMLNELRYGYAFTNEPRWGPLNGLDVANELGLQGLLPGIPNVQGMLNVAFSGLGLTGLTELAYRNPGFYNRAHFLQDHLSWFRGKHSIKAGAQIARYDANDVTQSLNEYGNLTFSNRYTGFAYSDFLLGLPTTARRAGPALDAPFNRMAYDFFVTDEYKITPKLTLSLGLRYELHPYWSAGDGLSSVFDIKTGAIVVPDGSVNKVNSLFPASYVKVIGASQAGYSGSSLITTDKNNFAPRLSLAWRPFGEKTVIRAGFGIFYDVVPAYVGQAGVPFSISEPAFTNPNPNPTVVLPVVFPNSVAGPTTVSLPAAFKKDLRIPYSIQYNITIEREITKMGVRLSYISTGTRQGEYAYNYNQPLPDSNLYVNKPRAFPQFTNFSYITNGAGHQYNSLNFEVKRRFASGLLYDFSWVWQRDIGDLEGGNVPGFTLEYQAPENAYNLQRERAVWEDLPTHRVTGDVIYQLPVGKGKKWLSNVNRFTNLALGGWEISSTYAFNTGMFLTPLWTGNDPTGTFNTSNTTPAQVTIRPNILSNPNLSNPTVGNWFNVGAFGAPTPGQYGTSAKGVIVGPGSWIIDSGIAKNFEITEHVRARCLFSATNILNHPNWGNPGLNITSLGAAGVITSTGFGNGTSGGTGLDSSTSRAFRLGLRLEW
jgi:hypothetical protein